MDMFKGMLSKFYVSKLRELGWKFMWGSGDAMRDHSYGRFKSFNGYYLVGVLWWG